jgi:hypothetical protein
MKYRIAGHSLAPGGVDETVSIPMIHDEGRGREHQRHDRNNSRSTILDRCNEHRY